jgi:tetratricopeptide (TPR) repeat protein
VKSICRSLAILALAWAAPSSRGFSEDLGCTRYVPQIGKTVRVRCNDEPARPGREPAPPQPDPGVNSEQPIAEPSRDADASPCLDEENPGAAMGICQIFLNNNGGLSQSTKGTVYKKLAYASLHIKDNQAALSWSKKALDIAPSPVEHYIAGQAYAALKNPSAAIEEFSAALVLAPKYTLAFHRRGEAYLEIGDRDHAKSDFQSAVALVANFAPSQEELRRLRRR